LKLIFFISDIYCTAILLYIKERNYLNLKTYTLKTQIWVKYGQTQMLG